MKQELILLESAYFDDGENFAELFKRSIETFLKSENFNNMRRQTFDDIVEYK